MTEKMTTDWTPLEVHDVLEICANDGHTIYDPEAFPLRVRERFVRVYTSNPNDHKATIFGNDGKVIQKLEGVYGLTVLETMAKDLGCPSSGVSLLGRGGRAREATKQLREWLAPRWKVD